ncbi:hypothetical protein ABXS75_11830 [Roseburia hominis]
MDKRRNEKRTVKTHMSCKSSAHRKKYIRPFRRFLTGVAAVLLIMICSFGFGSFFSGAHVNAQEEPAEYKYYKSVRIEEGDTFWSLAEEYMNSSCDSIYDYMDELAEINNLSISEAEHLTPGDYMLVACLDTQLSECE